MQIIAVLGLVAGVFAVIPRDLLVVSALWLVGQVSPSLASTLFIGALMMWH